jgi:hypothetical protein
MCYPDPDRAFRIGESRHVNCDTRPSVCLQISWLLRGQASVTVHQSISLSFILSFHTNRLCTPAHWPLQACANPCWGTLHRRCQYHFQSYQGGKRIQRNQQTIGGLILMGEVPTIEAGQTGHPMEGFSGHKCSHHSLYKVSINDH